MQPAALPLRTLSLAVSRTGVDVGQTKRAGSRELSFVLVCPLAWNVEKKLIFGTVPFWVVQRHSAWTSHGAQLARLSPVRLCTLVSTGHFEFQAPMPAVGRCDWLDWIRPMEGLQGSAVALASLFTFMQKEQQLEGWEVVPEHWAAGRLSDCIYHIVTNKSPAIPTGSPPSFLIVLNMRLQAQFRSLCS